MKIVSYRYNAMCSTWKGISLTFLFSFFAHIRTPITKSTCEAVSVGNPWWCLHVWRLWRIWLQFSHLPNYLFLRHMRLVNTQPRTKSCKTFYCSNWCDRKILSNNRYKIIGKPSGSWPFWLVLSGPLQGLKIRGGTLVCRIDVHARLFQSLE